MEGESIYVSPFPASSGIHTWFGGGVGGIFRRGHDILIPYEHKNGQGRLLCFSFNPELDYAGMHMAGLTLA